MIGIDIGGRGRDKDGEGLRHQLRLNDHQNAANNSGWNDEGI